MSCWMRLRLVAAGSLSSETELINPLMMGFLLCYIFASVQNGFSGADGFSVLPPDEPLGNLESDLVIEVEFYDFLNVSSSSMSFGYP